MCCILIWERVGSKIRERGYKEEILQLYCSQLSSHSCAIKIFSSTTASQYSITFSLSGIKDRNARIQFFCFQAQQKDKEKIQDMSETRIRKIAASRQGHRRYTSTPKDTDM